MPASNSAPHARHCENRRLTKVGELSVHAVPSRCDNGVVENASGSIARLSFRGGGTLLGGGRLSGQVRLSGGSESLGGHVG